MVDTHRYVINLEHINESQYVSHELFLKQKVLNVRDHLNNTVV